MIVRFVIAPVSMAASGNTSWMLKIVEPRRMRLTNHPVSPSVIGGDMAMTASTLDNGRPMRNASNPATSVYPAKPSARRRRFVLSSPGNGFTRLIEPHVVVSRRIHRPRHAGSIA